MLLIVDDDPAILLTTAAVLEDEGFVVRCAASFAEGKLAAESGDGFFCVLIDRSLGDGDGLELIPLLRAKNPGVSIVVMSGAPDSVPASAKADLIFGKGDGLSRLFDHLRTIQERVRTG